MTGHLLGGAGIIEAISSIGSIMYSIVPPTINHFTDDEQIDSRLDFTFNKAKSKKLVTHLVILLVLVDIMRVYYLKKSKCHFGKLYFLEKKTK
jgi:hypothetical protein